MALSLDYLTEADLSAIFDPVNSGVVSVLLDPGRTLIVWSEDHLGGSPAIYGSVLSHPEEGGGDLGPVATLASGAGSPTYYPEGLCRLDDNRVLFLYFRHHTDGSARHDAQILTVTGSTIMGGPIYEQFNLLEAHYDWVAWSCYKLSDRFVAAVQPNRMILFTIGEGEIVDHAASWLTPGQNLIFGSFGANTGFENTTGFSWVGVNTSSAARSSEQARTGTWSLKCTSNGSGINYGARTPTGTSGFVVTPGVEYRVSAYIRRGADGAGASTDPFKARFSWYTSGGTLISNSFDGGTNYAVAGDWYEVAHFATAPATAARCSVYVFFDHGVGPGRTFYIDDVTVQSMEGSAKYIQTGYGLGATKLLLVAWNTELNGTETLTARVVVVTPNQVTMHTAATVLNAQAHVLAVPGDTRCQDRVSSLGGGRFFVPVVVDPVGDPIEWRHVVLEVDGTSITARVDETTIACENADDWALLLDNVLIHIAVPGRTENASIYGVFEVDDGVIGEDLDVAQGLDTAGYGGGSATWDDHRFTVIGPWLGI